MQPAAAIEQDRPKARNSRPGKVLSTEALVACLFLAFAVVFNLYYLYPEAVIQPPALNDGVLHRLALERFGVDADMLAPLQSFPVKTYYRLDPQAPVGRQYNSRWHIIENLSNGLHA